MDDNLHQDATECADSLIAAERARGMPIRDEDRPQVRNLLIEAFERGAKHGTAP